MKLLAYILNGETLGVEKTSWEEHEFTGIPFSACTDETTIPTDCTDISSWKNWAKFGHDAGLTYVEVRNEIKSTLPSDISAFTEEEIEILNEYNLYKYFSIYDYINDGSTIISAHPPVDIDYDIIGLHKKRTMVTGELIKVEYFGNYNINTKVYSKKIVSEDRTYYKINQLLHRREMTIKWYLNDDSVGFEKSTTKYYSVTEGMNELDTRRANIISDLKINTVGLIMACSGVSSIIAQQIGKPMVSTYNLEMSKYVQGYEQELRDAIQNDNVYPWLNLPIPNTGGITIRQYLLSGLSVDYSINNINV
jgi:hypothetical protein